MEPAIDALELLGAGRIFTPFEGSFEGFCIEVEAGLPSESVTYLMKQVPAFVRPGWRWVFGRAEIGGRLAPNESAAAGRLAYMLALARQVLGDRTPC